MKFQTFHRVVAAFFTAGVLFLSLPPTVGAQTSHLEENSGAQPAVSAIAELRRSYLLPDAITPGTFTEPRKLAANRSLIPLPYFPELHMGTKDQRSPGELAAIPRWSPEKAIADLTPVSTPDFRVSDSSPLTLVTQSSPSTLKQYNVRWKPGLAATVGVPGEPYPYAGAGAKTWEIFRLTW